MNSRSYSSPKFAYQLKKGLYYRLQGLDPSIILYSTDPWEIYAHLLMNIWLFYIPHAHLFSTTHLNTFEGTCARTRSDTFSPDVGQF